MALGPIEIVTIVFPESRFTGGIIPQLVKSVANGTITIVDELVVKVGVGGTTDIIELDDLSADEEIAELAKVVHGVNGLISDEDVAELTSSLPPGSTAAILVFEHTWVKPLQTAILDAGGVLLDSVRVPGSIADEILESVAALESGR